MVFLINWLLSTAAIIITAYLLSGATISGLGTALIVALVLGILNTFIRPILLILTLPVNILTLGLFTFIINAIIIYIVAGIVPGFRVKGFGNALLFAVVLAVINLIIFAIFP